MNTAGTPGAQNTTELNVLRVVLRRVLGSDFGVVKWQFLEVFVSRKKRGLW